MFELFRILHMLLCYDHVFIQYSLTFILSYSVHHNKFLVWENILGDSVGCTCSHY